MSMFVVLVFFGVFAIVLLLSMSFDSSGVQARKETQERLESITLAVNRKPDDEAIGLIREDLLSSLPALNAWLQRLELFGRLRKLLRQAELDWMMTSVLGMSLACAAVIGLA